MRKIIFSWLLFLFIIPVGSVLHAETIQDFNTDIAIQTDGTIEVKEKIIYDFEGDSKHGIYRDIPTTKINDEGKTFRLTFETQSVTDEFGKAYKWINDADSTTLHIRIGDPDVLVTGVKTYIIQYKVSGALTYFSDHDELYWNITGNNWKVPIIHSQSSVVIPRQVEDSNMRVVCYSGPQNSTGTNCKAEVKNSTAFFSNTTKLNPGDGVTGVMSFPKGIVAVLEPVEIQEIGKNPLVLLFVSLLSFLWYIGLPVGIMYRWWKHGRDPKPTIGQASVWFDPPKTKNLRKLTPGESGTLLDEQADLSDISATIVDLARRGYLTITEDKKEYTLSRNQLKSKEELQQFEQILYDGLFADGDILSLKGKNLTDLVSKTKQELYSAVVREGFFDFNPETTRNIYYALGILGLITGNIPLLITGILFGKNMPKKTGFGSDQAAIGKALKKFLSSQEKFLNFQAEKMAMFEKLLPYAVAFGVEKVWAKRFENLTMSQPTWFVSSTPHMNSILFVNGLTNSMNSFRTAATPTKSSSGYSSGFSGGFSGGGGGGGGGGSW